MKYFYLLEYQYIDKNEIIFFFFFPRTPQSFPSQQGGRVSLVGKALDLRPEVSGSRLVADQRLPCTLRAPGAKFVVGAMSSKFPVNNTPGSTLANWRSRHLSKDQNCETNCLWISLRVTPKQSTKAHCVARPALNTSHRLSKKVNTNIVPLFRQNVDYGQNIISSISTVTSLSQNKEIPHKIFYIAAFVEKRKNSITCKLHMKLDFWCISFRLNNI